MRSSMYDVDQQEEKNVAGKRCGLGKGDRPPGVTM